MPGAPTGEVLGVDEVEAGVELGVEFELVVELDLVFCAQGGRSGLSWLRAMPVKAKAKTAKHTACRKRWGVIFIGY
jgi:hypothetical protein